MLIRPEIEVDRADIRSIHLSVFDGPSEANLVDALREHASPVISLVAEEKDSVVGHIMFSPVFITDHPDVKALGLAPMAIVPRHQRQGIGSQLVRCGIEVAKQRGFEILVVLGHAEYYPRFGFLPASRFGLVCEYDVPDEAFMAMKLREEALIESKVAVIVKYNVAFGDV